MAVSLSLKDEVYNRYSFRGTNLREKLSSNYFTNVDRLEDKRFIFMEQMKDNHRRCPYWKLLKYYCPCSLDGVVKKGSSKRKSSKPSQITLLGDHCSMERVYSFTCAVLKRLLPLELFGSHVNRKNFFKNVKPLLFVQKYGEVSLLQFVRGIKISKIVWLRSVEPLERNELLLRCVHFLVTKVICPLIQSYFYCVESSFAKNRLFAFRKRVWHKLCHRAFIDFSKFCNLKLISENVFHSYVREGMCLGHSRMKFILKKSSLRPVCSFKDRRKASVNDHLKPLLLALKFEKETNPASFGIVATSKMDFHRKIQEFILKVKKDLKSMYFVTVDVEKCFDSLNPTVLFDVVTKRLNCSFYVIHRYKKNVYGKDKKCRYFESVHPLQTIQHRYGDVELIDHYSVNRDIMLQKLKSFLMFNVMKFGTLYYLQKRGIAQGSKVSSILSDAYLAIIEEKISLPKGLQDFSIRIADEYLVITSTKSTAESFLKRLTSEMKLYGCSINFSKCQATFDCNIECYGLIPKSSSVKFYGLCLHETGLISCDYSSYTGLTMSDVTTLKLTKHPGQYVKEQVQKSLYLKCDAILFDGNINTKLVIQKNVLRIFCLTAMKYHFLVMCLSPERRIDKNLKFFYDIILSLPSLLIRYIHKHLSKLNSGKENKAFFPLPVTVVKSLCNGAFLYKMKKHQNIYQKLIPSIEQLEMKSQYNKKCNSTFIDKQFVKEGFGDIYLR